MNLFINNIFCLNQMLIYCMPQIIQIQSPKQPMPESTITLATVKLPQLRRYLFTLFLFDFFADIEHLFMNQITLAILGEEIIPQTTPYKRLIFIPYAAV